MRNIPGSVLWERRERAFFPVWVWHSGHGQAHCRRARWPSPQPTWQDEKILLCSPWTQWQSNGSVIRWASQLCAALGFACFWYIRKQSWKSQRKRASTLAGTRGPADTGLSGSVEGLLAEWDKWPRDKWVQQAPAYPRSSRDTTPSTKLQKGFAYKSILSIHQLICGSCPLLSVLKLWAAHATFWFLKFTFSEETSPKRLSSTMLRAGNISHFLSFWYVPTPGGGLSKPQDHHQQPLRAVVAIGLQLLSSLKHIL